jgi:hypothetical protein
MTTGDLSGKSRLSSGGGSYWFLITPRFAAFNKICEYTTWNFNSSRNGVPCARAAALGSLLDATAEPNCSKVFPPCSGTTLNQERVRS